MIIISFGLAIVLRHGLQFIFGYPERSSTSRRPTRS